MKITGVRARQVLDSRGYPTVEAEVSTRKNSATAIASSGSSAGKHEAVELRDSGKHYFGSSVLKAVENVNSKIAPKLKGMSISDQRGIDQAMIRLDGTSNKSKLGANAIVAVSMAACRLAAKEKGAELYSYIGSLYGNKKFAMPVPMFVFIEGGKHAVRSTDFQEFMLRTSGIKDFQKALQAATETYHALGELFKSKHIKANVGSEGAYTPPLNSNEGALEFLVKAVEEAGYSPGKEISIALDTASSEFLEKDRYMLKIEGRSLVGPQLVDFFSEWVESYPITSIEDPLAEDDWDNWVAFTKKLGTKIQVVADDLTTTNVKRMRKAIDMKAANAFIIKPNQIGTVSETLDAMAIAKKAGLGLVVSHRAGDSEDCFIADLAVGTNAGQCKFGATSRGERTAKYNRLLRINEQL